MLCGGGAIPMRGIITLIVTFMVSTPAMAAEILGADAVRGCVELAASGEKGALSKLTDVQLERGLCLSTRAVVQAIAAKDRAGEQACMLASEQLGREFRRRWPKRSMKDVSGKC
jgi:hypothetical protein